MRGSDRRVLPAVRAWVKAHLGRSRLAHVRSVVRTARDLARRHGVPLWKAELAAWLHDAAKEMTVERMKAVMRGTPFRWDAWERRIPALLHGQAAAALAWKKFKIRDEDVLAAVRHHTMGRPRMERLETLLFVADYIEPRRDFPEIHAARREARRGLHEAALAKAETSHDHLSRQGKPVHPRLRQTRDWLRRTIRKGRKP